MPQAQRRTRPDPRSRQVNPRPISVPRISDEETIASVASQKFVEYVSPRCGRQRVAHGVSRGSARPPSPPSPLPLGRERGAEGGVRAVQLILFASEGRGFSPAAENGPTLRALAPEAESLQGLKALSTALCVPAGLKPRPSRSHNNCAYSQN
ncbi:hypothetical protein SBA2_860011 [Acidobacteriia bacterium SbA2]|nr:hypothetical protein SBA2_860011 [Acidobacteriia bacterium SbA2]